MDKEEIESKFRKISNCEIEKKSDLAALKDAKKDGNLNEVLNAVGMVQGDHEREEIITSGIWIFKVIWNDSKEAVQVSAYGYSSGIIYEGEGADK